MIYRVRCNSMVYEAASLQGALHILKEKKQGGEITTPRGAVRRYTMIYGILCRYMTRETKDE